ncbi:MULTISPECIES: acyltransferase family protein [Pseudoalteromonas]|uniref:Acyltransferase n=1 Tax=Pseudoalteromonas amylolytica TaxID=1859457 RepID=A0A1S1MU29_9GAMM|nr:MULTISPECIES: acyltransferase [Pseudoalteromonas]OHU84915.1 acyltransferase [Pseudoalteromonas sp. JW3]OHU90134.1 acyltransferase [Pseudoalteromonas amylolytica]
MQIRKLNTLRGLAALIVFFTHFSDITNWLDGALGGGSGAYGVMLFFLLSGFLMSYLYLNQEFTKTNVSRYFLARAGRVLPLYLLVVLCSFFLTQAGNTSLYEIPDVNNLLGHLLFLYGESVLWSIPPEIQFYFVFIVFWALAKNRAGYIYLLVVALMIGLFLGNFPKIFGDIKGVPYNEFNVLRSLPFFFVGMLFGMHYKSMVIPHYLKSHWFILALCLIPLLYPEFSPVKSDAKHRMWLSYEVLLLMGTVFFCVVFLVPDNNVLLANRVGDFVGQISYSLYLLHMPIIHTVNQLSIAIELKLALSLILSVLVAYLSFRLFERPIAKVIRRAGSAKQSSHSGVTSQSVI